MPNSPIQLSKDEVIRNIACTCIDGRSHGLRYSAAGGSFGLIAHLLSYLERERDIQFDEPILTRLVSNIAEQITPVYLHSDQSTVNKIYQLLNLNQDSDLKTLTPAQQKEFIYLASQANFQGCGHIGLMMQNPSQYQTSTQLLTHLISCSLTLYSQNTPAIEFDILAGEHSEDTVLIVEQETAKDATKTTLFSDEKNHNNPFYCHRPLKRELLKRMANLCATTLGIEISTAEIETLSASHDAQAELTLHQLARDLPIEKLYLY